MDVDISNRPFSSATGNIGRPNSVIKTIQVHHAAIESSGENHRGFSSHCIGARVESRSAARGAVIEMRQGEAGYISEHLDETSTEMREIKS
jgi:hypothetical protein